MTDDWDFAALATEELDPELVPWVEEDGVLGPALKHPLVFDIGGIIPGLANKRFQAKKDMVAHAVTKKDWHQVVFLHERPYRASALFNVVTEHGDEISDADYWELVGSVWIDSENIWQNTEEWDLLLGSERGDRLAIMDENDLAVFHELPERIPVFRGCTAGLNDLGLSWTTDRERAVWFARRFANLRDGDPIVLVGTVAKSDVVAYFGSRNESEIVAVEGAVDVERAEDA